MKKDWTYKKLGEVADTYRGLTYSKKDEVEHSSKAVLRSNNIDLTSHQLNFDEIKYIREDFVIPQDKLVKKDSIFICMSNGSMQHLGKVAYIDKEYNFAFGGFMGLVVPKEIVNAKYVYYSMLADNFLSTIMKEGKGANINNLRFSDVENYLIPIPPLSIQRSIVAELDLLHSVISKKKEQLRELDNLAQSLFYQMFGDPITNPMGWEIKKLGEVAETYRGLTYSKKDETNVSSKKVLRSNNIDFLTHSLDLEDIKYLRDDFIIPEDKKIKKDSIFICMSNGSMQHLGKVAYIDKDYDYAFGGFMGLIVPRKSVSARFVYYNLLLPAFLQTVLKEGRGANINNLRFSDIENFSIILPPLSLQQSFAAKVSAIEAQKQAITQSIKETEALLAQRMDRYFS